MLKSYFKIAYRNLLKSKVVSLINILGLAIGMTVCLLITQYVSYELSYDTFHQNADRIYRIAADYESEAAEETTLIPPPLGPMWQDELASVANHTRMILPWSGLSSYSTLTWYHSGKPAIKRSFLRGFFVDPGFFSVFSFPLIHGDPQTVLDDPRKIVLSESAVQQIFGSNEQDFSQLIGQTVEYTNDYDRFELVISGIVEDSPENSHFQYDFLASFSTLSTGWGKDYAETWNGNSVYTYVQLAPIADLAEFKTNINHLFTTHAPQDFSSNVHFSLQPLTDIHLHSHREGELSVNGNAQYIYFLSALAVLIVFVAIINYINMTMAKAVTRSEEMGLRKLMGAQQQQIISQFFLESTLYNCLALGLAITAVQILHPWYTQFIGKEISIHTSQVWLAALLLFVFSTLLAGIIPALKLSYPSPFLLLKGKGVLQPRTNTIRGMVVAQFWASMVLILFTFAIVQQLRFMRNYELGFNQEGVIVVTGPENRTETWIEHHEQKSPTIPEDAFKTTIAPYTGVKAVSFSRTTPGERGSIYSIQLAELHQNASIDVLKADNDYASVYDLKLLAGTFDTSKGSVISQSTAEILGYTDPNNAIGQAFRDERSNEYVIMGVVQDYYHQSLQHAPQPFLFSRDDFTYKLDSYYSIKVSAQGLNSTLEQIEEAYTQVFPYETFDYYFVDDYFNAQYQEDTRFGQLFGLFSALTIFVACLGLFGLTLHTVVEKTKEIGIRKVLGASVQSIVKLLSWDYLRLVLIASLLALPVGYWVIQQWLRMYAVRTEMNVSLFLTPIAMVLIIALLTVSIQTIRAALANPTESLRYE
ncbi:MAG: ABC transporter permease [Bacteroidota bacterium]